MDSPEWENLNVKQKLRVVSADIKMLLEELCQITAPGGKVDSSIDVALESFKPLLDYHGLVVEEKERNDTLAGDPAPSGVSRQPSQIVDVSLNKDSMITDKEKNLVSSEESETVLESVPSSKKLRSKIDISLPGPSTRKAGQESSEYESFTHMSERRYDERSTKSSGRRTSTFY